MSLGEELQARMRADGLIKPKVYVCPHCYAKTPCHEYLHSCPECKWQGELGEASTEEAADRLIQEYQHPSYNKALGRRTALQSTEDPLQDLLTKARGHYYARENPAGDQAAAEWLLQSRSIITEPRTGTIYVYDRLKGHYVTTGEAMLRSDLVRAFGSVMNRTRIAEILTKVAALSYRDTEELESTTPPNLIPFLNGVYDLQTQRLLPHSPAQFFTYAHPVRYDPTATCPAITKFLNEIVEAPMQDILTDIAGLCLYRDRLTRHFFILVGEGHNGKSKYLTLLRAILGKQRCVSITPHHLEKRDFTASQLHDKHADLGADIPGGIIRDLTIVKSITGGDFISVEFKGKDRFETRSYAEIIYSSNTPPRFSEDTRAVWDRLVSIRFPFIFLPEGEITEQHHKKEDLLIEQKILKSEELSGFVNLALKHLEQLRNRRALSVPVTPERTRAEYAEVTNTPVVFLEQECESATYVPADRSTPAEGWISRNELYRAYQAFCIRKKLKIETSNTFGRRIREAPGWNIEDGRESLGDGQRVLSYQGVSWPKLDAQTTDFPYSISKSGVTCVENKGKTVPGKASNGQHSLNIDEEVPGTVLVATAETVPAIKALQDLPSVVLSLGAGKPVPVEDLLALWPGSPASFEVAVAALKQRGDLYEPRPGYLGVLQ